MRITIAGSQKWASTTGTANEPAGLGDYTSMPGNAATLEMRSIRAICGAGSKKWPPEQVMDRLTLNIANQCLKPWREDLENRISGPVVYISVSGNPRHDIPRAIVKM